MVGRLVVHEVGWLTTVQDGGRRGLAALGVPRAGPLDVGLAAAMNRQVGNPGAAGLIETGGGLVLGATDELLVATSSALAPMILRPGLRLRIPIPTERTVEYVAVSGGVVVDRVLGSMSHDTLSGLGPEVLTSGVELTIGPPTAVSGMSDLITVSASDAPVGVWPGPHLDLFGPTALTDLCAVPWRRADPVNRIAARFTGVHLAQRPPSALASVGLVPGAVQVHPDGSALVMLADHPTTGGYPVVAVVDPEQLATVAQCPPGRTVSMTPADRVH